MKKISLIIFILLTAVTASFAQSTAAARAELKRLNDLGKRLDAIPMNRLDRPPHKAFIKKNEKDIVYSDPAGQYFVRSDRYWALHKKYQKLPIAEEIAWTASQNSLPGECEGYINCYVYKMTVTDGRYLQLYPNGKHASKAIASLVEYLETMTAADSQYDPPADAEDRAVLKKTLSELRSQIAATKHADKTKILSAIAKLEKL